MKDLISETRTHRVLVTNLNHMKNLKTIIAVTIVVSVLAFMVIVFPALTHNIINDLIRRA